MKNSFTIFVFIFIIFSIPSFSQDLSRLKNWQLKQYALDAESKKNYESAKKIYIELAKRQKENTSLNYKIALLEFKTRNYKIAKKMFLQIYEANENISPEAFYYYNLILKMQGKYEAAEKNFTKLYRSLKNKNEIELKYYTKLQLKGIKLHQTKPDSSIFVHHLDKSINKPHLESSPIIVNDTAFIYCSYNLDSIDFFYSDTTIARPFMHFYLATKQNNKWTGNLTAPKPFFNFKNKSTANGTYSLDHKRFYFTVQEFNDIGNLVSQLYYSKLENGEWGKPIKIGNNVNTEYYNSTQPTVGYSFNTSQEIIYFISDRPKGWGGYDLWFTIYDRIYDKFSEPVNAGGYINSFGDEMTPFYNPNDKKMYFSSNSYPSLGGFDIFYSVGDITNWVQAQNLGQPINSSYDDFYFSQSQNKKTGFFISNRDEALDWGNKNCCFDIFYFNQSSDKHVKITGKLFATDIPISEFIQNELLNDTVPKKKQFEKFIDNAVVSLQIMNNKDSTFFTLFKDTTDKNGNFNFILTPNQDYNIAIQSNGFLLNSYNFSINNSSPDSIDLGKIETQPVNQKNIILRNILFNFNSSELTNDSKLYLDTLVIPVIQKYSNTIIEIGAHTDTKGSNEYNQRLSQERAQAVVDYLTLKGVLKRRLIAVGYGESKPIASENLSDGSENSQASALNRRVEFKIIGLQKNLNTN